MLYPESLNFPILFHIAVRVNPRRRLISSPERNPDALDLRSLRISSSIITNSTFAGNGHVIAPEAEPRKDWIPGQARNDKLEWDLRPYI